jgi:CRISPR-associated endonuclease/helicase Cas3
VSTKDLSATLAERAWARGISNRRVIVFSNSRKVAQEVEADLDERVKRAFGKQTVLTGLLVGERRLYERTLEYDASDKGGPSVFHRFKPGAAPIAQPAFLVATSAGEVGIDLDADDLVCDLVPWERMVQRFGRVNRRADPGVANIDIIPSLSDKDAESVVAAERFEQIRAPFTATDWALASDGTRDASPGALRRLKASIPEKLALASTPAPFCPKLDRPTVQSFAMTSLREHSGRPSIQPYLRGWTDDRPQGAIMWRRLFPVPADFDRALGRESEKRDLVKELDDFFEAAPPHMTELLEAPADRIAETIKKRIDAYDSLTGEQRQALRVEAVGTTGHEPIIIVLDSRNDVEDVFGIAQFKILARSARRLNGLLADHTVVIDARLGGLSESGLLDSKASKIPPTIDDAEWKLSADTYGQRQIKWGSRPEAPTNRDWRFGGYRWKPDSDNDAGPVLWVEVLRSTDTGAGDPAITRRAQALEEHHEWTREEALRVAHGLELPESKATMLATAAFSHDAGKARQLWQNAMNADLEGRPFAKTTGGAVPQALAGYRHEFGSLGDILEHDLFSGLEPDERELAFHIVAAHHGRCRPVVNASDPERAPSHSRNLAQETAIRYIRLERIWGTWGLAWWETMLRSADWAASARANKDA